MKTKILFSLLAAVILLSSFSSAMYLDCVTRHSESSAVMVETEVGYYIYFWSNDSCEGEPNHLYWNVGGEDEIFWIAGELEDGVPQ